MCKNKWQDIWSRKATVLLNDSGDEFSLFCELKKADGFDVAVGDEITYYKSFYDGWIEFYNKIIELTPDCSVKSVYEVGCGSGVNLFMFRNRIPEVEVGGCDYSSTMIESARRSTGSIDFLCCGADEIDINPQYDLVMSESVFQYFESLEYAEKVLRKMIKKSNKIVYLGEIHDKQYEDRLIEYRKRTIDDYEERYKGLSKLFLDKDWIKNIVKEYGKKVLFTKVDNPEYINAQFEFNCYIY